MRIVPALNRMPPPAPWPLSGAVLNETIG